MSTAFQERARGKREGRDAGEKAIVNGDPRVMRTGELGADYDDAVGLPLASVGCEVSEWALGFCEGYNQVIAQALKDGRIHSLARKIRTVETLLELFHGEVLARIDSASSEVLLAGSQWALVISKPQGQPAHWVCDEAHPTGAWLTEHFEMALRRTSSPGGGAVIRCAGHALILLLDGETTLAVAHPTRPEPTRFEVFDLSRAFPVRLR